MQAICLKFKHLRKEWGLNQGAMATKLGINQSDVSQIERGNRDQLPTSVIQILNNSGVSLSWLFNDSIAIEDDWKASELSVHNEVHNEVHNHPESSNQPYIFQAKEPEPKYGSSLVHPKAPIIPVFMDQEEKARIPILDVTAAAGLPQNVDNTQFYERLPSFALPQYGVGEHIMIQIEGDSMHPTIMNQDWVIARRVYDVNDIKEGYVHIIVSKTAVVAKRALNRIEQRQALALMSDNEGYSTYDEPVGNILQVWRAVARMSSNFTNLNAGLRSEMNNIKDEMAIIKKALNNKGLLNDI